MKYLFCKEVEDLFGVTFSNNVASFVRKHVLPHKICFLYCHQNDIIHYGEYGKTLLEGTTFGLKDFSISTHLGLLMDKFCGHFKWPIRQTCSQN